MTSPTPRDVEAAHPGQGSAKVRSSLARALDDIGITRATKFIILLTMFGGFFDVFEQNGAGATGPALQKAWGLSTPQVALLATVTFSSMVVGGIVAGLLADRAGRKTLFTFNLAVYTLGGLLCAIAPNYGFLLIGRVIVGLGLGGELTIALPLISEFVPTRFRGIAVSLFNMGAGGLGNIVSFIFATLVVGVFGETLDSWGGSWRWYFGLLALPALLVLYMRRRMPETPWFLLSQGRADEANRSLSIVKSGRLNPRGLVVEEFLTAEDVTAAETTRSGSSGRSGREIFRPPLLRSTLSVGIGSFMSFGGQIGVLTVMPIILVERGLSITNSLLFTAIMQAGALLGTAAAAYTNLHFPRRRVVASAAVLAAVFGLCFGYFGVTTTGVLVFGFLFNFFVLISNTTLWAWAPELYPTRVRGFGTGVTVNTGLAGQAIVPLISASILATLGVTVMFIVVAAMYVVLVGLALLAPETHGIDLEVLHGEV
jgi:MFS family permease